MVNSSGKKDEKTGKPSLDKEIRRFSGEIKLRGIPVSPGISLARVCLFNENRHAAIEEYQIDGASIGEEHARLVTALERAKAELKVTARKVSQRLGAAEAEIFAVQASIMEDAKALKKIKMLIETERRNAESAVMSVFTEYETRFAELSNDYMRERAGDIAEARRRLLDALTDLRPALMCEGFKHCRRGRNRIIVARELSPSLTVEMDSKHVRGFVTERGGATSHAAILARALGIPSVSGLTDITNQVACGTNILVNGNTGEVILHPGKDTLAKEPSLRRKRPVRQSVEEPLPDFAVMANISLASTAREAKRFQAEGIGLYRTEFEHIVAGRLLSASEQYRRYASVTRTMQGQAVVFRLLDMGGDKGGELIGGSNEQNPALGLRGSRLLLRRPDLLDPQLQALGKLAGKEPLAILYPMIVDLQQFIALRNIVVRATSGKGKHPVRHGVMFEVPAACLQAADLLQHADFGSIGTNDLAQHLFAADRDNEHVTEDLDMDRPALWQLIGNLADAARHAGKPLTVCGEMATEKRHLQRLRDLGLCSVSVNIQSISGVRKFLKES